MENKIEEAKAKAILIFTAKMELCLVAIMELLEVFEIKDSTKLDKAKAIVKFGISLVKTIFSAIDLYRTVKD